MVVLQPASISDERALLSIVSVLRPVGGDPVGDDHRAKARSLIRSVANLTAKTDRQQRTSGHDNDQDDMVHIVCTGCDRALCGSRIKGIEKPAHALNCVVCVDMGEGATCPHCGLA